jgi:TRAP-type mannitol/chloroaromatic compound transport system permease large subunit
MGDAAGVAPVGTYKMIEIYKGVMPFIILQIIGILVCALFPPIITYIPGIIFK